MDANAEQEYNIKEETNSGWQFTQRYRENTGHIEIGKDAVVYRYAKLQDGKREQQWEA